MSWFLVLRQVCSDLLFWRIAVLYSCVIFFRFDYFPMKSFCIFFLIQALGNFFQSYHLKGSSRQYVKPDLVMRLLNAPSCKCYEKHMFVLTQWTQLFRSIFVPVSGTPKDTVHTGTERLRIGFCFCSHGNAIVPFHSFLFSHCHFSHEQLHSRMCLGQKSYRSVFWTTFSPHCLFTRERNGAIASFHFSYHLFYRSTFWNATMLFQAFPCERNPWAFHFSERNDMEQNDCVPVWTGPKLNFYFLQAHASKNQEAIQPPPLAYRKWRLIGQDHVYDIVNGGMLFIFIQKIASKFISFILIVERRSPVWGSFECRL